jgi:hypothetical protein
MKDIPATYDIVRDMWILDVKTVLSLDMVEKARQFIYKVNLDRRKSMFPGDKREMMDKALRALEAKRIEQRLSGKGDQDLFKATERTSTRSYFFNNPLGEI